MEGKSKSKASSAAVVTPPAISICDCVLFTAFPHHAPPFFGNRTAEEADLADFVARRE
jgi:hypothetical protein